MSSVSSNTRQEREFIPHNLHLPPLSCSSEGNRGGQRERERDVIASLSLWLCSCYALQPRADVPSSTHTHVRTHTVSDGSICQLLTTSSNIPERHREVKMKKNLSIQRVQPTRTCQVQQKKPDTSCFQLFLKHYIWTEFQCKPCKSFYIRFSGSFPVHQVSFCHIPSVHIIHCR